MRDKVFGAERIIESFYQSPKKWMVWEHKDSQFGFRSTASIINTIKYSTPTSRKIIVHNGGEFITKKNL